MKRAGKRFSSCANSRNESRQVAFRWFEDCQGGFMHRSKRTASTFAGHLILSCLFLVFSSTVGAQSLDEIYKQALKEGGHLIFTVPWRKSMRKRFCRFSKNGFRASR